MLAEVASKLPGYRDRVFDPDRAVGAHNVHAEGPGSGELPLGQQIFVAFHDLANAVAEERAELGRALGRTIHERERRVEGHADAFLREHFAGRLDGHLPLQRLEHSLDAQHVDPGPQERPDLAEHGIHYFIVGGRLPDDLPRRAYIARDKNLSLSLSDDASKQTDTGFVVA